MRWVSRVQLQGSDMTWANSAYILFRGSYPGALVVQTPNINR